MQTKHDSQLTISVIEYDVLLYDMMEFICLVPDGLKHKYKQSTI